MMDRFSFLNAAHSQLIEDLYQQYLRYPDSLEPSWKAFFQGFDFALENYADDEEAVATLTQYATQQVSSGVVPDEIYKEFKVVNLIEAYRERGHLFTKTNPVRERRTYSPTLAIENFGLTTADLDTTFNVAVEIGMSGPAKLRDIITHLEKVYCDSIGTEYMHIYNVEEKAFVRQWLHVNENQAVLNADEKKEILHKLNQAVAFENYLHTKFVGQKRFSLEGGESLIPALDQLITRSSQLGVDEVVLGMAHRGRLNVLSNIFGKSYKQIFSEFEGKEFTEDIFSGDVKYHLGASSKVKMASGEEVRINLVPNPSHLETVAALVEGICRAKVDNEYNDYKKVLPIVIHGDGAVAGQGLVYEVAQMMTLDGYKTGGTIHIVVNNQVSFTTNYLDARSAIYCTDIAKVTQSPVMHVNADNVEAVVHAIRFAAEYRAKFGKDVYIDLLGYRKYGHNEGDEPKFTQPKLYKEISKHPNPREIYKAKLLKEGIVSEDVLKEMEAEFKTLLDKDFDESKGIEKNSMAVFMEDNWKDFSLAAKGSVNKDYDTSYDLEALKSLATKISTLPADKKFLNKIVRLFASRLKMIETNTLDWAMGELLAYATLLEEGKNVRISGEDVERGTFSHRHAVVKTEDTEEEYLPLRQVNPNQRFDIFNSHLSEYGVLGFDYGYAMAAPNTLTIWEAQFGDFANGAQIIIDQYLVAAEEKWKVQNGLVMLLPHGSEGQGAEHSSARLERFLTLCANDNIIVANCTTPANYFHLLRRQMKFGFRKPLVVMTPKSLLRHPKVVSKMEELANGSFQPILDDTVVEAAQVKKVVLCTGKLYYELLAKREELNDNSVALVRLEQIYPLHMDKINEVLAKYEGAQLIWAQEEPENMGAWSFILRNFRHTGIDVVAPVQSGAPAPGSHKMFEKNQTDVINRVFGVDHAPESRPVTA